MPKIWVKPLPNDAESPLPADVRALLCCHYQLQDFTGEKCLRMLCKKLHLIYFGQCHWLRGKNAREMLLRWKKQWQLLWQCPKFILVSTSNARGKHPGYEVAQNFVNTTCNLRTETHVPQRYVCFSAYIGIDHSRKYHNIP